jgi:hypothetical protein
MRMIRHLQKLKLKLKSILNFFHQFFSRLSLAGVRFALAFEEVY